VTNTATDTATATVTNTATDTPTNTATNTATDTPTNTATSTATNTATDTPTNTSVPPTNTATDTPTNTSVPPTNTATDTPTNTVPPPPFAQIPQCTPTPHCNVTPTPADRLGFAQSSCEPGEGDNDGKETPETVITTLPATGSGETNGLLKLLVTVALIGGTVLTGIGLILTRRKGESR
jgi:hypothetical protein